MSAHAPGPECSECDGSGRIEIAFETAGISSVDCDACVDARAALSKATGDQTP